MIPNVADFVGERDGIFVNIQRLRRGRSVRLTSGGRKMGGGAYLTLISWRPWSGDCSRGRQKGGRCQRSFRNKRSGRPNRFQTEGRSLPPRKHSGKGPGTVDVQHANRARVQFYSHLVAALVEVVSKILLEPSALKIWALVEEGCRAD